MKFRIIVYTLYAQRCSVQNVPCLLPLPDRLQPHRDPELEKRPWMDGRNCSGWKVGQRLHSVIDFWLLLHNRKVLWWIWLQILLCWQKRIKKHFPILGDEPVLYLHTVSYLLDTFTSSLSQKHNLSHFFSRIDRNCRIQHVLHQQGDPQTAVSWKPGSSRHASRCGLLRTTSL